MNHLDSLRTGAGLAQDLDLGRERFQQRNHALACKRFIINHKGSTLHRYSFELSVVTGFCSADESGAADFLAAGLSGDL